MNFEDVEILEEALAALQSIINAANADHAYEAWEIRSPTYGFDMAASDLAELIDRLNAE